MNKLNDTAVLKTALEQYNRLLCAALPGKEELEGLVFSPRFETRMAKLIRRQKRFYYPFVNTAAKRAACILAVILLTLSGLFSVKSIRDSFAAFLTEVMRILKKCSLVPPNNVYCKTRVIKKDFHHSRSCGKSLAASNKFRG